MDITKDLKTWNEGIKNQKSSSIADVCNMFLLPIVICQWGYSDFIHKSVYIDLDTVMQRFIQKMQPLYCKCIKII